VTTSALGIAAPPEITFATICDAETYPQWLVGAHHIRSVDDDWPAPGSSFHHALGLGPVTLVRDRTTVLEIHEPRVLVLLARIGPVGAARVRFTVTATDTGSHLAIEEEPAAGILRALWNPVTRPAVGFGLWGRNAASLQALRALVEERAHA
jgi:uncharacterized protein YndB with AHSA1/START domain